MPGGYKLRSVGALLAVLSIRLAGDHHAQNLWSIMKQASTAVSEVRPADKLHESAGRS